MVTNKSRVLYPRALSIPNSNVFYSTSDNINEYINYVDKIAKKAIIVNTDEFKNIDIRLTVSILVNNGVVIVIFEFISNFFIIYLAAFPTFLSISLFKPIYVST
jgi:hypothetical protein